MSDWMLLNYDPESGAKTEMRLDEFGNMTVRETMPVQDIVEEAKARRLAHDWKKAIKNPYVPVASIPLVMHDDWVRKSGLDSATGAYDRKYYTKKFLNDSDYENLRLIPGKV